MRKAAAAQSRSWLDEIRLVLYRASQCESHPTNAKKKSLLTVPVLVETHYIVVGRWCLCRGCGSPKITPDITNKPFCLWCKLLNAICEWGTVAHIFCAFTHDYKSLCTSFYYSYQGRADVLPWKVPRVVWIDRTSTCQPKKIVQETQKVFTFSLTNKICLNTHSNSADLLSLVLQRVRQGHCVMCVMETKQ